jgi:hypothetical protein
MKPTENFPWGFDQKKGLGFNGIYSDLMGFYSDL